MATDDQNGGTALQITEVEKKVVARTRDGEIADFSDETAASGAKPAIRAAFLRRLLLQLDTDWPVRMPGVRVRSATIEGALDLGDCSGAGGTGLAALELCACDIAEPVELSHARLARLCLDECALTKVRALEARIDGPVSLRHVRAHAQNGVCSLDFDGARIGGSVDAKGAHLRCDPHEPRTDRIGVFALTLRNAAIAGNVLLRPGFRAHGGVSLHGAQIGGLVDLRAARLTVNHRYALSAGGLKLAGALHINGGFRAEGPIFLRGAQIGDGLHADGGVIAVPEHWSRFDALNAEGAHITGGASLKNGFSANGVINLRSARVRGGVALHNASFSSLKPYAIDMRNAEIEGEVAGDAVVQTGMSLAGAQITRNLDLRGAQISARQPKGGGAPAPFALDATNIRIGGAVLMQGADVKGEINLADARIEGYCGFGGGRFSNGGGWAVRAPNARIGGNLTFKGAESEAGVAPTVVDGAVKFDRARIEGEAAWEQMQLEGSGPGGAPPLISFVDCQIGRALTARALEARRAVIDLSGASCASLNDDPVRGWGSGASKVRLEGFHFERLEGALNDRRWRVRTRWLRERAETFSPQPYAVLARFYARAGLREDMRRALLAERDARTKRTPLGVTRVLSSLFGLVAGYGFSPARTARALVLFLALGIVGVTAMLDRGMLRTNTGAPCGAAIEPALFAIDVALPVIDLGQESVCAPAPAPREASRDVRVLGIAAPSETSLWRWGLGIYAILGALLSALAVITFSGVMRPKAED